LTKRADPTAGSAPPATPGVPQRPVINVSTEELSDLQNPAVATNQEAWRQALKIGLLGLGGGAALRGLIGIKDVVSQPDVPSARVGPRPTVIQVPVPERGVEEEEKRRKYAEAPVGPPARPGRLLEPSPTGEPPQVPYIEGYTQPQGQGLWDRIRGLKNVDITSKPWFMPAAVGLGAAGIYGGYKGVDALLGMRQKADRKKELENAKQEYQNALVEQYEADGAKRASSLAADLDELSKTASLNDAVGKGMGAYLTLAGLLATGAGLGTYSYVKSRQPDERLAKAIKQRERLRWASRPPEIYAISRPLSSRPPSSVVAEDEDEQERSNVKALDSAPPPLGPRLSGPKLAVARLYR